MFVTIERILNALKNLVFYVEYGPEVFGIYKNIQSLGFKDSTVEKTLRAKRKVVLKSTKNLF